MKCVKCSAEIPGHAQFCMRCGTPIAAARPGGAVVVPGGTGRRPKTGLYIGLGAIAVLAALLIGGGALLARSGSVPPGSRVVQAPARAPEGGPLTERGGRIGPSGPVTDNGNRQPGPADPTAVIDYLEWLKSLERKRVALTKQQLGQVLTWSSTMTARNLTAEMGDNPEEQHKKTYSEFQTSLAQWSGQWQGLSQEFLSYGKPVPQACATLHNKYYDVLGKTSSSMATVGSSFSQALSGNPSEALNSLSTMQGSASKDVDDACNNADRELAAVCDKYRISKGFDIKADGGAANPFGVGR